MSRGKELVLFTDVFPFGQTTEPFLEAELPILAEHFERVLVLPSSRQAGTRPLPPNVELVEMPWLDGFSKGARVASLLSGAALTVLAATLTTPGHARAYRKGWRTYLDLLARNLLKARQLEKLVAERSLQHAVFLDYWFENSTLALALLRRSGHVRTAVCRAHGFDVYDERWTAGRVPYREFKARWLNRVFPVSAFGARYLEGKSKLLAGKLEVARLGVPAQELAGSHDTSREEGPSAADDAPPLVISTAHLEPFKRIHLIPEVLAAADMPLRWIHFGDGVDRARVEAAARRLPACVEWELRGQVPHEDVISFYRQNHVRLLLSLSVTEGLPVSMMEALSFGVPVLATEIQGIPEIVNAATGLLMPEGASPETMASRLVAALARDAFDPQRVVAQWAERYDAARNYSDFASRLKTVSSEQD